MNETSTAPEPTRFSFPQPSSPLSLDARHLYVIAIHSLEGVTNFIGPFTPRLPIKLIGNDDVVFHGNFRVRGYFPNERKEFPVVIPKDGRAVIYKMEYSLYQYNDALGKAMHSIAKVQAHKKNVLASLYHHEEH
jgi:hypothetical protein